MKTYPENIRYSKHGRKRLLEGGYSIEEVRLALSEGEIIEEYPDTGRGRSHLVLDWIDDRPIHVVAANKTPAQEQPYTLIVTVYDPRTEADEWTDNFSQRQG